MDLQPSSKNSAFASSMGVDYIVNFNFSSANDKAEAATQFENLIAALDNVGMRTTVRPGTEGKLLVFVRFRSTQKLIGEVYRSRVKDWLHGIRPAAPDQETQRSLDKEPLTGAERLRVVHSILTHPESEGGAGITPGKGQWTLVEGIFPLHDHEFNKEWMKRWSTTWAVSNEELGNIRDMFGEKVAFYFAFLESYFSFLVIAACFGVASYFLLPQYSLIFAVVNCLWSVVFVEQWKRQEVDLAVRWNVRSVSQFQSKRAQFQPETETKDPVTGEIVKVFPAWKRLTRQSLQIPFALGAGVILSALFAVNFGIEVMISEVYNGPFKSVLMFTPTVIGTVTVPILINILSNIATKLTEFENYEHDSAYEAAMVQKVFVFNFICSYVPLFLTAFVYVPFAHVIVPYIDVLGFLVQPEGEKMGTQAMFQIDPDRLRKQVIYFTVTAQAVNLAMETIVPYFKRKAFKKAKEIQDKRSGKEIVYVNDSPDERDFLDRVRNEAELDVYDVNDDLREMCMQQFGYLCLFSPVWPLTAVSFLVNNWIELRSDAAKICVEMRRPIPHRADSIGPWLDNIGFLTWLGSVTSAALVYMFSTTATGSPNVLTLTGLLGSIVFSEHIYFVAQVMVRTTLSKLDSPGLIKERQERFIIRRRYLQESMGVDEETEAHNLGGAGTFDGGNEEFWGIQKSPKEAVDAGKEIINISKKEQ
ncbi:calcium-activated chloride channel-domain-containing protein [Sphaerosporella brunnea]|uniref:Calcium-activated chloride channel-domain-containing protein n=1 Tax=Sphaerosporella brunnea TaxID=1250544 RepID=A0A5J5EPU6_9PEZI|nr:calcium-activated chloride channel-domain-containing protein [Sphaerosporella brunnea]